MEAFDGSRKSSGLTQQQCLQIVHDLSMKKLRNLDSETHLQLVRNEKKLEIVRNINKFRSRISNKIKNSAAENKTHSR